MLNSDVIGPGGLSLPARDGAPTNRPGGHEDRRGLDAAARRRRPARRPLRPHDRIAGAEDSPSLIRLPRVATTKRFDVKDLKLAPEGSSRIEWADRQMPVLAAIRERFAARAAAWQATAISACLHVTTRDGEPHAHPQGRRRGCRAVRLEPALDAGRRRGRAASRSSTSPSSRSRARTTTRYYQHIEAAVDHKPQLTMDDGADVIGVLHSHAARAARRHHRRHRRRRPPA